MHKQVQSSDTVQRLSHELLLLLARFADEDDEASVIRLFRETVNSIHGSELMGEFRDHPDGPNLPLATARSCFGGYPLRDAPHTLSPEMITMLRAAAHAVAVILESNATRNEVRTREHRLERDIEVATRELSAQTESYRLVLDNMQEAIYLWELGSDGALRCMEANAAASRMLGYGRDELVGLRPADLTGDSARRSVADCLPRLHRESRCSFATVHVASDGAGVPVQVEAYALATDAAFYVVSRVLRAAE
ncbi:MAG: PAS domain-containing protein [Spirochaetes bacterium]|nr:PAS domain-containing protein [Spirochaetota bacterium]